MKFNKSSLLLFIWICALASAAAGQKIPEKPFEKWSKEEAVKILTSSPWVQTYQSQAAAALAAQRQISEEQNQTALRGGQDPKSVGRDFGPPPVVIRLHSALPVRQALARLRQLQAGYDKMDEKERAAFDKTTESFINCAICRKYHVVTLTKFLNSSGQSIDEGVFQRMTFEELKGNVWLVNEKGDRRELAQFNPPKNAADMAVFYFARHDDKGNSFLTAENKKFEFVFKNDFLDSGNPYAPLLPRRFEFNVSKLLAPAAEGGNGNGELLF